MRRTLVVLAAVLALAACGGSSEKPAGTTSSTTATVAAGPAAFYTDARRIGFGEKDFASATDEQLLVFGNSICEGFTVEDLNFAKVTQGLLQSDAKPDSAQVDAMVKSAVTNLCPDQASQIP